MTKTPFEFMLDSSRPSDKNFTETIRLSLTVITINVLLSVYDEASDLSAGQSYYAKRQGKDIITIRT